MESEYKSPLKKLVKFFEESRNKWKAKAQESKQKVKLQGNRIRFLEESKLKLKADVLKLKSQIRDLESKNKKKRQQKYTK